MIYFIGTRDESVVKVGYSRAPLLRLDVMQTGCPFTLHLIAATSGDIKRESELHRYLAKEHYRGEWFTTGPRLRKMIERAKLGLDVLTGELPRVKREWWPFDPDTPDMGTESRRWFESLDGDWDKRQRGEFAPQF